MGNAEFMELQRNYNQLLKIMSDAGICPRPTATGLITSGVMGPPTYKTLYEVVKREADQERREKYDLMGQLDAMRKAKPELGIIEELRARIREDRAELRELYRENGQLRKDYQELKEHVDALMEGRESFTEAQTSYLKGKRGEPL